VKLGAMIVGAIAFLVTGAYWAITRTDFLKMIGLDQ